MSTVSKTKKAKSFKKQRSVNKLAVGHISHPMNMNYMVDMVLPHLELDHGLSLVPKNFQAVTEQTMEQEPRVEVGFRCGMGVMGSFQREPADGELCYICGDDGGHEELCCPFNYMYMSSTEGTCKKQCNVGKHTMAVSGRRDFLRCVVRVNNMPPKLRPYHLASLCKVFGPLRMYHMVVRRNTRYRFCRGFGYAIFWSREHAERAIKGLNGRIVDGRKLRVDWAYPCI